uniref:TPR-like protein n=1 Tax=Pseudo-nitzschia australis TaxID=44445 RepID=A0A7S4AXG8_9STRA|mmetsp:Transcript_20998/g.44301  ORF Transcript_20998/g.44301 Transcript_20998/m.44301 type:complete len:1001 (+) Transcript_20998:89-3091(+)|eukprot:CAMPEP_0168212500 /NCGR_PEP_ID=MMETSP0140_2-20121125/4301_1 /TAXON_ID=44445 /ORGANISM="Pseudo-nitzschia australis, Strain 10249 10 AB" /LENGTH=1000 /DNA_ID=CAMNT_0008139301 /DNA_START=24 /DNA_END=3026 /DNA_ORIENTATION=+
MIQKTTTSPDAACDSDGDSECSGFGFAALDFTGVNFDEGDGNDADESDALKLSEEDALSLKLEKGLLMTGDYTSLENIIHSSTEANEEGKTTDPSSSSAQWKRLRNLTELVIDGRYIVALKSPSSQWLLEVEDDCTKNCDDNYDHYFWDRVQQKLLKLQTVSECVEAEIVGIAAFNLFLQLNYTGPSLDDMDVNEDDHKESASLEGINPHACFASYLQSTKEEEEKTSLSITNKRDTTYHNSVLSELTVDGMWPCQVAEVPYLLLLARSIFSNLVPVSTDSISLPKSWMANDTGSHKSMFSASNFPPVFVSITSKLIAAPLWSARATVAHERLLLGIEPSERLWNEIEAVFDRRCLVDFDVEDEEDSTDNKQLKAMTYLEYGLASHYFEHAKKGKRLFDLAKETSGLTVEMTGAEGKRTKYQNNPTAQMIIRASSAATPSNGTTIGTKADPSELSFSGTNGKETKSKRIEHNEESHLLENIKYEDENDNSVSELNVLDQSIILALCLDVKNTNPADGLTGEEMNAYLARVLHHHDDWIIYSTALLERAWLEFEGNHTKERAILQIQALADQHTNRLTITQSTRKSVEESSPVQERLRNIHSIVYPPRWQMLGDIADRYASLGIVTTAAEIFTDIEYWDEAVECYKRAGKDSKAEEIVKERISINETPRMWMALGDLTNDPAHYEKAIELSRGRFSMAHIALGKYYFDKNELEKSASAYTQGLKLRPLVPSVWFRLGTINMKLGNWETALTAFSEVVQQCPDSGDAWSNVAAIHMHNKNQSSAFPALVEALKLNRNSWQNWESKLYVCLDLGKYDEAIQACNMLLDLKATHSAEGVPDLQEKCVRAIAGGAIRIYDKARSDGDEAVMEMERRRLTRVHGLLERIRSSVNEPWIFETMAFFHHQVGQDKQVFENLMKEYRALSAVRAWERDDYQVNKICLVISQIVDYQRANKEELMKSKFLVGGALKKIQKAREDMGQIPDEVFNLERLLEDIAKEIQESS